MDLLRRLALVFLGGRIFKRRLSVVDGANVIYADVKVGGLKYLRFNPVNIDRSLALASRLLVRQGDIVWDVGANLGLFTQLSAFHAGSSGHLYAFECNPEAYSLLNKSTRANRPGLAKIDIFCVAISNVTGIQNFDSSVDSGAASSLSGFGSSEKKKFRSTLVPTFKLDDLHGKILRPDVVKIDVEGAELLVLKGGENLIQVCRPLICLEVMPENWKEMSQFWLDQSYVFWPLDEFVLGNLHNRNKSSRNIVAIPSEKFYHLFPKFNNSSFHT